MLDGYQSIASPDRVLPLVVDYIAGPKAVREGKVMAIQWLATILEKTPPVKNSDIVRASAAGMQDKNGDVREAGLHLMTIIIKVMGRIMNEQLVQTRYLLDSKADYLCDCTTCLYLVVLCSHDLATTRRVSAFEDLSILVIA